MYCTVRRRLRALLAAEGTTRIEVILIRSCRDDSEVWVWENKGDGKVRGNINGDLQLFIQRVSLGLLAEYPASIKESEDNLGQPSE